MQAILPNTLPILVSCADFTAWSRSDEMLSTGQVQKMGLGPGWVVAVWLRGMAV